jgi:propanediol dehydratase large subunit
MFHVEHPLAKMDVNVPRGTLAKFSEGIGPAKIVLHVEHLFEAGFRGEL